MEIRIKDLKRIIRMAENDGNETIEVREVINHCGSNEYSHSLVFDLDGMIIELKGK